MAERPIFVPSVTSPRLVETVTLRLEWNAGFSATQKQKNVRALHAAAAARGFTPVLEVSTKSEGVLGRHLSAFHLAAPLRRGPTRLECAFQGSKVFERGGPFTDLYAVEPQVAKRDPRLRASGRLVAFDLEGRRFPLEPQTFFYDWLYINAIYPHRRWLQRLQRYAAFSDIEFNPGRSVNCQARTCALFVALMQLGGLDTAVESPASFLDLLRDRERSSASAASGQTPLWGETPMGQAHPRYALPPGKRLP